MSRSGYSEDCYGSDLALWRGAVERALQGKRGQAFLRELVDALDALPEKRLETGDLVTKTGCCAMGAVAIKRGLDVTDIDPWERDAVADIFGIAESMAAEIAYLNDDYDDANPEARWARMRAWAVSKIRK